MIVQFFSKDNFVKIEIYIAASLTSCYNIYTWNFHWAINSIFCQQYLAENFIMSYSIAQVHGRNVHHFWGQIAS